MSEPRKRPFPWAPFLFLFGVTTGAISLFGMAHLAEQRGREIERLQKACPQAVEGGGHG